MIGTVQEVFQNMESDICNFCKDGKCSNCGQCCSALLPLSEREIKDIKRYVRKKHIQTVQHDAVLINKLDMTCPFLDESKEKKCRIYPVRPMICREFKCDIPPSKAKVNRDMFWKRRKGVYMWDVDWSDGE